MKLLATVLTLSLAVGSFSEPIKKRALSDYTNIISGISAQVAVVSGDVTDYVAGAIPGTDVQASSNVLVSVINAGAAAVPGFAALNLVDALALVTPIQNLADDTGSLVDQVIGAKPDFDGDALSDDVLASLQAQKTAAEALSVAITAKVPASLKATADALSKQISDHIQRGIDVYN